MSRYAELHAHSAFSFLDGASQPEELAIEAAGLGLSAMALTDHDGLYGVVRFAQAASALELPTLYGAELGLADQHLLVLARGTEGYRRLSRGIARAHLAGGTKGGPHYDLPELADLAAGNWLVLTGCRQGAVRQALEPEPGRFDLPAAHQALAELTEAFGTENVAVEITDHGAPWDSVRNDALADLAEQAHLPLVATGAVHCARPDQQPLTDVLAALGQRSTLEEMDQRRPPSPAHLRSPAEMAARHHRHPRAVATSAALAAECSFDLDLIAPALPPYPVPQGHTEASWLRELTYAGAYQRYGPRHEPKHPNAYATIERELDIIIELGYPGYFLIVHQIVQFCRDNKILCQGRGSAANSAVCYALGITAVDAVQHTLLFERFLAPGRSGPPDIDLDIESDRREEVIQHVYARYGRTHAAQVANVISYRPRSAVRDAARAFGYDVGQQDAWSKNIERWGSLKPRPPTEAPKRRPGGPPNERPNERPSEQERLRRDGPWTPGPEVIAAADAAGGDLEGIPQPVLDIAEQMLRLPRHLGIHSGGMVLCDRPVIDVCPVEWATMPGRTVLQWDKDDCADAGLVKFDLLGLGMLTALRLAFTTLQELQGLDLDLHSIPQEDPAVYDLLCAADTVGVFQVESRAQMATLPRLRPRTFYDIVVEVALIRPGPIQGNSVHPYIRRARGLEEVTYLHPLLEPTLKRTLGIPLFQEQLMQIAVDVAGFTPAEADQLRRAMGSKRSAERMAALRERLMAGMAANGLEEQVREQVYDKLKAFADFGFPESHAFSFAYLVYASAWLKVHHPEAFYAGLLAAQPMGFYSPQTLVADARRRGVRVHRASVDRSAAQAMVVRDDDGVLAVQLGLAPVRGVGEQTAERVVAAREQGLFADLADLTRRVHLSAAQVEALATAGALACFGHSRREALWLAGALAGESGRRQGKWVQEVLPMSAVGLDVPELGHLDEVSTAVADVWATGVSVDSYPTQFLREELDCQGVLTVVQACSGHPDISGRRVRVAGVVTHRQRPATARGVTFLSLEDETGLINVICSAGVWAKYRKVARASAALVIRGVVEYAEGVTNLTADQISPLSLRVPSKSRDFR